ncbi:MAG: hypothetical protein WCP39_04730, partial [Chlamydiota bacterium]
IKSYKNLGLNLQKLCYTTGIVVTVLHIFDMKDCLAKTIAEFVTPYLRQMSYVTESLSYDSKPNKSLPTTNTQTSTIPGNSLRQRWVPSVGPYSSGCKVQHPMSFEKACSIFSAGYPFLLS